MGRPVYSSDASFHDSKSVLIHDKRKQSLYFPEHMLNELLAEANRQERSLSWLMQQAWKLSRKQIKGFQSAPSEIGE